MQCKVYTKPLNSKLKSTVDTSDNDNADEIPDDDFWFSQSKFGNDRNTTLSVKEKSESAPTKLTDYQYMLCTPILRGYSLKDKKWRKWFN